MLTFIYCNEKNYVFLHEIISKKSGLFYSGLSLFNLWLNRRKLEFRICFHTQSVIQQEKEGYDIR